MRRDTMKEDLISLDDSRRSWMAKAKPDSSAKGLMSRAG